MQRLLAAALLASMGVLGNAHAAQADHVIATQAWIRLLPANLPAAGYVVLRNNDAAPATITSAHSNAYASAMIHQSMQDANGIDHMTMVDHLKIPAHGAVAFSPNGYHLMLEQATHAIKTGDHVTIALRFADGSELAVPFIVRPANAVDTN
jgi:periplasmic copper chaperone A